MINEQSPVTSLDQLFAQTYALGPILLAKVKAWARPAGLFPVRQLDSNPRRPEFVRWHEVEGTEQEGRVKWGRIKSEERAIEKLLRSYDSDVSKLVDLVRQSIIFDSIADLVACVREIESDRDVVIVRIKNRLHTAYNSRESAGYRDLLLNLRIETEMTMMVGVETHVCEVQLILRHFAELKSDEGHRNYVEFRNARGE